MKQPGSGIQNDLGQDEDFFDAPALSKRHSGLAQSRSFMKICWIKRILAMLVVAIAVTGCVPFLGGNPSLPQADKNGTFRVFAANEAQTSAAITNAFAQSEYREMYLALAVESHEIVPGFREKKGFVLEPFSVSGSIAHVPLQRPIKKWVPYVAFFWISVSPVESQKTKVTVHTILAEVIDGKEPGIPTEWENHYRKVPPVRQEEENVLAAIAEELSRSKGVK